MPSVKHTWRSITSSFFPRQLARLLRLRLLPPLAHPLRLLPPPRRLLPPLRRRLRRPPRRQRLHLRLRLKAAVADL